MRKHSSIVPGAIAALIVLVAALALAQEGGAGRSGPPPECVAGKHVIRTLPAPPRAMRVCRADADCTVAHVGCCGSCSSPPLASLRAVATTHTAAWRRHTCASAIATCPACAELPHDADITAVCVRGLCELTVHDAACTPPTGMGTGHS